MAVTAAIASIVIGTGVAAKQSHDQRAAASDAKKESKRQEAQALALQEETKAGMEKNAEQTAMTQARARQRALAYSSSRGNPNVATTPLGVPGAPAATGPKTLLGM